MNLPALPACADHAMCTLHGRASAFARDAGQAEADRAPSHTRRPSKASILVMRRHDDHVGGAKAPHDRRPHGLCRRAAHERVAQRSGHLTEAVRTELPGSRVEMLDGPGRVAGPVANLQRGADEAPLLLCGGTPRTLAGMDCSAPGCRPPALAWPASFEPDPLMIDADAALRECKSRLQ